MSMLDLSRLSNCRYFVVVLMIVCLAMSSCTMYHPATVSIPLMGKKGDLQLSAGILDANGPSLSVAYAPTDHIALQTAVNFIEGGSYLIHLQDFRAAVGYHQTLGSGIIEGYAGYAYILTNTGDLRFPYVQCNYGWTHLWHDRVDIGFGLRGNYLCYFKPNVSWKDTQHQWNCFSIDPQFILRFGPQHLKFTINGAWTLPVNYHYTNEYAYFSLSVGLSLLFR